MVIDRLINFILNAIIVVSIVALIIIGYLFYVEYKNHEEIPCRIVGMISTGNELLCKNKNYGTFIVQEDLIKFDYYLYRRIVLVKDKRTDEIKRIKAG